VRRRSARIALLAAIALAACRHLPLAGGQLAECPGALRSTGEIRTDFRLEQRVRIRSERDDVALRLAVEKRGPRLVLIGLNPLGAKLFTVIQTGSEASVESLPAAVVQVPPLNVLRDLHRARFLGADVAPDVGGHAEAVRDGTRVVELWRDGVLLRRSFARVSGRPHGEIVVEYDPPQRGAAARVQIRNGWCGYEAGIETLSEETLP
jgi:hypothetical protein